MNSNKFFALFGAVICAAVVAILGWVASLSLQEVWVYTVRLELCIDDYPFGGQLLDLLLRIIGFLIVAAFFSVFLGGFINLIKRYINLEKEVKV